MAACPRATRSAGHSIAWDTHNRFSRGALGTRSADLRQVIERHAKKPLTAGDEEIQRQAIRRDYGNDDAMAVRVSQNNRWSPINGQLLDLAHVLPPPGSNRASVHRLTSKAPSPERYVASPSRPADRQSPPCPSRFMTTAMRSSRGDHLGTPTLVVRSVPNVICRAPEPSVFATQDCHVRRCRETRCACRPDWPTNLHVPRGSVTRQHHVCSPAVILPPETADIRVHADAADKDPAVLVDVG